MGFLGDIFGGGLKGAMEGVDVILSRFKGKPIGEQEKAEIKLALEQLLQKRDSEIEQTIRTELTAKERILVAELSSGDNYTRRARPTVVYFGLLVITYNYCVIPTIQTLQGLMLQPFALPTEFWIAWGGIVSTWVVGRSAEKRGTRNRLVSNITGAPLVGSRLLDEPS